MAKKKQTPRKKIASTTLKPYVYANGRVAMFDPQRYAKAVKASRHPKGWQAEQRARRKKEGEGVRSAMLEAVGAGLKVSKAFLKLSARPGARTFIIRDGKSVAELARWLGDPKPAFRRTLTSLEVVASAPSGKRVTFGVSPQSADPVAGDVARWIVQTAALLLFGAEGPADFVGYQRTATRNASELIRGDDEDDDDDEQEDRSFIVLEVR